MKILIFANSYENYFNFRKSLIASLLKKNHKIYLILPRSFINKKTDLGEINPIYIDLDRHGNSIFNELILIYKINQIYKKIRPDYALHFTIKPNIYGSIASRINKIKNINNVTGLGTIFINNRQYWYLFLYKFALRNSFHTFFQNKFDQRYFKIKKIVKDRNSVIPGSGINLHFNHIIKNPKIDEVNFLFIGRLINEKGIMEFLRAAEFVKKNHKFPKVNFNIIGSFDSLNPKKINKDYFNTLIKEQVIKYLGYKKNVKDIITIQHCIVLPSYREGMSHSLLHAASLSKALIVSNVPGCKELVIDNYNGFLCRKKNTKSLIECIIKFIKLEYEEKLKFGQRSREIVQNDYDENIVIKAYLDLLK